MDEIVFGEFVLDARMRTLCGRSGPIALRRREFDLLLLLASNLGAAVSKHEILDRVWGSDEASEAALTQCVYRLRRALAGHAPDADFIGTIPRRGYRLLIP